MRSPFLYTVDCRHGRSLPFLWSKEIKLIVISFTNNYIIKKSFSYLTFFSSTVRLQETESKINNYVHVQRSLVLSKDLPTILSFFSFKHGYELIESADGS